ncbi:MAG: hypothetical protein FJW31_25520 [Acidobacteria bacterium]|nr:hypothetical protein [Acidobacteriota bacterium]
MAPGGIALWSILRQPREKNPTRLPKLERAIEARTRERVKLIAVDDKVRRPSGHDDATPIPRSWTERMTIPELVAMTRLLSHKSLAEMAVMIWVPQSRHGAGATQSFCAKLARTDTAALLSGLDKARTAFPRSYE